MGVPGWVWDWPGGGLVRLVGWCRGVACPGRPAPMLLGFLGRRAVLLLRCLGRRPV